MILLVVSSVLSLSRQVVGKIDIMFNGMSRRIATESWMYGCIKRPLRRVGVDHRRVTSNHTHNAMSPGLIHTSITVSNLQSSSLLMIDWFFIGCHLDIGMC